MDPELQAIREARMAELKNHATSGSSQNDRKPAGDSVAAFLQPQALERLSRVSLVRPDRVRAVEAYLQQLVARGQVSRKITEPEIVEILNGVARDEERKTRTRIIFDRKGEASNPTPATRAGDGDGDDDDDDDFFD